MNVSTVSFKRILRITMGKFFFFLVSLLYGFGKLRMMAALRLTGQFLRCLWKELSKHKQNLEKFVVIRVALLP